MNNNNLPYEDNLAPKFLLYLNVIPWFILSVEFTKILDDINFFNVLYGSILESSFIIKTFS